MATNLIDKVVAKLMEQRIVPDRQRALLYIARLHDAQCGLYSYAKAHGVLVDNSAEDFSIQFYSAYNKEIGQRY